MSRVTCELFQDSLEELAVGAIDEPLRSRLLVHASGCVRCQSALDQLSLLTDQLLLLGPELDPPSGFEERVLARIDGSVDGRVEPATHRRRSLWWLGAAAALVLAMTGVAMAARLADRGPTETSRAGEMLAVDGGAPLGSVRLVAEPAPHVLVSIDEPRPSGSVVSCELELADGRWVSVGTWSASDAAGAVWAAGVDDALLDAVAMRLVDADGQVIATAIMV